MSERDELRQSGRDSRQRLGLDLSNIEALSPSLAPLLDEVVFGRIWSRPSLDASDRMLATLAALSAKQYLPHLKVMVGSALDVGLTPRAIQEVMLHCAMYAGMPTAIASLETVQDVFRDRNIPTPTDTWQELDLPGLYERGQAKMQELHGERANAGYADPNSAAANLYATAIDYLYGEIWNRPGLTTRQRMVCSVAAFTALQMTSQQLKFYRSALNVGLSKDEVYEVIMQTGPYSGFPPALNALATAEDVFNQDQE